MNPRPWLSRVTLITAAATACALAVLAVPAGASAPGAARGSRAASGAVTIDDITIDVPVGPDMPVYVVRTSGHLAPQSQAGILFLHWLGDIHNDRTEYLAEAVTLASHGVVSVLPQGTFPWGPDPVGKQIDVRRVQHQEAAFQAALDTLAAMPAVDPDRIGLVGHDYGAMYGALVADADPRVSAMVLQAPDALFGNWFAKYWLQWHGDRRDAYLARFADLDPVNHTARLGDHVLFQWAGEDIYVPEEVRDAYAASSPDAQVAFYPNDTHLFGDAAQVDRDAFLAAQLGFLD
jgi:dienelactone hydrolase